MLTLPSTLLNDLINFSVILFYFLMGEEFYILIIASVKRGGVSCLSACVIPSASSSAVVLPGSLSPSRFTIKSNICFVCVCVFLEYMIRCIIYLITLFYKVSEKQ